MCRHENCEAIDGGCKHVNRLAIANIHANFTCCSCITVSASGCTYDASPPVATIGQEMVIKCNLPMCFGSVSWCKYNGSNCSIIESATSIELVVSTNVTSATEVGGQQYECHCSNNASNCKKYNIAGMISIYT